MPKSRNINQLPGYTWVYKGEETWSFKRGNKTVTSNERHAIAPDGTRISVRQAQNLQRANRAAQGAPKPAAIPRTGRTKRIVGSHQPGKSGSLYDPNVHGHSESWVFRSFQDAQNYFIMNKPPEWASSAIIQIRFTERLIATTKVGSDKVGKRNGYASISPYVDAQELPEQALGKQYAGKIGNAFTEGLKNLGNYDMSGPNARVYVLFQEQ